MTFEAMSGLPRCLTMTLRHYLYLEYLTTICYVALRTPDTEKGQEMRMITIAAIFTTEIQRSAGMKHITSPYLY